MNKKNGVLILLSLIGLLVGFLFYGAKTYTFIPSKSAFQWIEVEQYMMLFKKNTTQEHQSWIVICRLLYIALYISIFNLIVYYGFNRPIFTKITLYSTGLLFSSLLMLFAIRFGMPDYFFKNPKLFLQLRNFLDTALTPPSYEFIFITLFLYLNKEWNRVKG